MKKQLTIKTYRSGEISEKEDWVAEEKAVRLVIDEMVTLSVSMSPSDIRAFAHGYVVTSGLVENLEEIKKISVRGYTVEVHLKTPITEQQGVELSLPSGCGGGNLVDVSREKKKFREKYYPDFEILPSLYRGFQEYSDIFDETGGVHSAAASNGKEVIFFSEDIGRHNAVDKVVGKALLAGVDLGSYFLMTSGRISSEIVKKAFYAGFRCIVSRSAPTCAAIVRARRANLGLIAFLRGKRFNIY